MIEKYFEKLKTLIQDAFLKLLEDKPEIQCFILAHECEPHFANGCEMQRPHISMVEKIDKKIFLTIDGEKVELKDFGEFGSIEDLIRIIKILQSKS